EKKKEKKKASKPKTYDDLLPYWKKRGELHFNLYEKQWMNLSDDYKRDLKEAFPALDIDYQFKKMKGWCLTHKTEAKSKRDWPKFIYNWLSRERPEKEAYKTRQEKEEEKMRDWEKKED
ncbi:MAG: hypothetical protein KAT69_09875, partial [Candidatus Aminicenantes bacterium]|nr:hypothetical protein [Candidatus Aminicenantes bacterium]